MLWFVVVAGVSVLAVTAYRQLQRQDSAAADRFVEALRQVTALIVVIGQSVTTALEALTRPSRPYLASDGGRTFYWDGYE